jgi:hypothetical protein
MRTQRSIKLTLFSAFVFLTVLALWAFPANAAIDATYAQVWGYEASAAGYSGQDAYLTTPNPNIGTQTWTWSQWRNE